MKELPWSGIELNRLGLNANMPVGIAYWTIEKDTTTATHRIRTVCRPFDIRTQVYGCFRHTEIDFRFTETLSQTRWLLARPQVPLVENRRTSGRRGAGLPVDEVARRRNDAEESPASAQEQGSGGFDVGFAEGCGEFAAGKAFQVLG